MHNFIILAYWRLQKKNVCWKAGNWVNSRGNKAKIKQVYLTSKYTIFFYFMIF